MKNKTIKPIEEVLKAGNDGKNQSIKQKFVQQHVFCNVGTMVEFILNASNEVANSPFTIDDIENFYSYPELAGEFANFDGGNDEQREEEIKRLQDLITEIEENEMPIDEVNAGDKIERIQTEIEELEALETEPAEIFEWWAVSSYLYDKLKENGYCVVDAGSCYVWGRTTTGQAILLDYAITKICADMGILEGQENEW